MSDEPVTVSPEDEEKIVKLQALARGNIERKEAEVKEQAAIKMQSQARGYLQRKKEESDG